MRRASVGFALVLGTLASGCGAHTASAPDGLEARFEGRDAQLARRLAEDLFVRAAQARERAQREREPAGRDAARREATLWLQAAVGEARRLQAERRRQALTAEYLSVAERAASLRRALSERRAAQRVEREAAAFAARLAEAHAQIGLQLPAPRASGPDAPSQRQQLAATRMRVAASLIDHARLLLSATMAAPAFASDAREAARAQLATAEQTLAAGDALAGLRAAHAALAAAETALGALRKAAGSAPTAAERRAFVREASLRGLSVRFEPEFGVIELPAPAAFMGPGQRAVTADLHTLEHAAALLRLHPHGPVRIEIHVPPVPPHVPPPELRARARRALRTLSEHRGRVTLVPAVQRTPGPAGLCLVLAAYGAAAAEPSSGAPSAAADPATSPEGGR